MLTTESSSGESVVQEHQQQESQEPSTGLRFKRFYTTAGVDPFDAIEWEVRDARIANEKGDVIFEQRGVEAPKAWSQTATNVVVSKYFRGQLDTDDRETSVRQLISRVTDTMTAWGLDGGYFATEEDAQIFRDELTHILVNQHEVAQVLFDREHVLGQ